MFDFLKRQKLQRQGYSCGKKRREQNTCEWVETLRCSPWVRSLVVAAFLTGLSLLVRTLGQESTFHALSPGNVAMGWIVILCILAMAVVHLRTYLRQVYDENSRFLLVFMTLLLHLGLLYGVRFVLQLNGMPEEFILYLAPVGLAPMLLTLLLGKPAGFFAVTCTSLFGTLLADSQVALDFMLVSVASGLVAMWTTQRLRKRSQLMRAGFYSGLTGIAMCLILGRMEPVWMSPMDVDSWKRFGTQSPSLLLNGIFTATIVGGLLPVLEALFRITTTISWIELSDLNHPLLRRMTLEAPGTYHHSLMVANLSEAAAEAIGADTTVCRVCSYFHDIGKLNKPEYCIENISGHDNPHDDLTPTMSALVIMAHVKDGVDLAIKHKLNSEIIDVIQQHHGTSIIYYFYRRALDQQEEIRKQVAAGKASPEDIPEVSERSFRYSGPKPDFKESAIVSLADAVESASRSLSKPTPQKIEQLVDEIIRGRIRDGQLDECDLTLNDLKRIGESFTKTLRTALHRRIPYPDEKDRTGRDEPPRTERREIFDAERREREKEKDRTRTRTLPAAALTPVLLPPPDQAAAGNRG